MHLRQILTLWALLLAVPATAQSITKESLDYLGTPRTYYQFIPKNAGGAAKPAPVLVLLHGSGRNGKSLVDEWKDLAKKEGIVLVGPDAKDSQMWQTLADDPGLFRQILDTVRAKVPIDDHRIYLFGNSAGACYALLLSLLESEYFAATAIHAGSIRESDEAFFTKAKRKIPVHLEVGTEDKFFPLAAVRAARDFFAQREFPVELVEIPHHDHRYYDIAAKVNRTSWDFLKAHALAGEPKYEDHGYGRYAAPAAPKPGTR